MKHRWDEGIEIFVVVLWICLIILLIPWALR